MSVERPRPRSLPSPGGKIDLAALLEGAREAPRDRAFELELLTRWQCGLPLEREPFACMAREHRRSAREVMAALCRLQREGLIAGLGAQLTPAAFGASTLAALAVRAEQRDAVAAYLSLMPEVSHHYAREHEYNLWFVLSAARREQVNAALARIAEATACQPLDLPMLEGYHLDGGGAAPRAVDLAQARMNLEQGRGRLLAALQQGLALVPRPYARLAMRAGWDEDAVIAQLREWCACGAVRRLGVMPRVHASEGEACAMGVWDVPDACVQALGRSLTGLAGVSLCYRRARAPGRWPFNLYCMLHGASRDSLLATRAGLVERAQLQACPSALLFALRRFKGCDA